MGNLASLCKLGDVMKKMVLVTISGGVPTIYADHEVNVVVLDYDDARQMHPDEMNPIHLDFFP